MPLYSSVDKKKKTHFFFSSTVISKRLMQKTTQFDIDIPNIKNGGGVKNDKDFV